MIAKHQDLKHQITNSNLQINPNNQCSKTQTRDNFRLGHWYLVFGYYLKFGAWNLGFTNMYQNIQIFRM